MKASDHLPNSPFPKIGKKSAPQDGWAAETRSAMDSLNQGRGPLPEGRDDPNVTELLASCTSLRCNGIACSCVPKRALAKLFSPGEVVIYGNKTVRLRDECLEFPAPVCMAALAAESLMHW